MEIFIVIAILLHLAFLVYFDIQNRRERERLYLKIMAKDINEYKNAVEPVQKVEETKEEDQYLTIEEAGIDAIVNAKEI